MSKDQSRTAPFYRTCVNYPLYKEYFRQGWDDGPSGTFMPTYKQDSKTGVYIDKKDQCPSYTDRILFRNNSALKVIMNSEYRPLHHVKGSDHQPV